MRSVREETADIIKENMAKIEDMRKSNLVLKEELEHEKKVADRNNKQAEQNIMKLRDDGAKLALKISEELKKKDLISRQISECQQQIEKNRNLLKNPENEFNSSVWYAASYPQEKHQGEGVRAGKEQAELQRSALDQQGAPQADQRP